MDSMRLSSRSYLRPAGICWCTMLYDTLVPIGTVRVAECNGSDLVSLLPLFPGRLYRHPRF